MSGHGLEMVLVDQTVGWVTVVRGERGLGWLVRRGSRQSGPSVTNGLCQSCHTVTPAARPARRDSTHLSRLIPPAHQSSTLTGFGVKGKRSEE